MCPRRDGYSTRSRAAREPAGLSAAVCAGRALSMARILVVDDEPEIVRGLTDNLRYEGHEALSAGNGADALAVVSREAPDLVILDIMMPVMSGWDVAKELRRRGIDVPIIMLTARGEEADRVRGLELGADDYVTKPFSLREHDDRHVDAAPP